MGYLLWSDFSKELQDPLTWDVCQTLFDRRGYKPKHLRKNSDDKYLDHKAIASHTYIAYDKVRTCWTVFLKYWGGSRWRKIAEVYLNNEWRVFADCDPIYGSKDVSLTDVKAVMALPDKIFGQGSDMAHISNLAEHRLNQLLPVHIYNKKLKTYINNKHLPFKNGHVVTYDTNYSYPKWWIVAPHTWYRGTRNSQFKEVEKNRIQLDRDINLYVRQFTRKTFRRKEVLPSNAKISLLALSGHPADIDIYPSAECDWMAMISTQDLGEEKQDRYRTIIPWRYFLSQRADVKLYQMFTRAISIENRLDESVIIRSLELQTASKKDKKFWAYCWPVYLLYLAIRKETIWPQAYIKKFLYDYQRSEDHTETYKSQLESITRVLLKKYLKRFYSKFLLLRCTDMGAALTESTNSEQQRCYGSGISVPEGLQDLSPHRRY